MNEINEIVVISGKGGTGKTTLTASIIPYLDDVIIADCDVDAPDLNILFELEITKSEDFIGTQKAVIDYEKCIKCGKCYRSCNFGAITKEIEVNIPKCEGCGVCEFVCPVNAIEMKDAVVGKLFVSNSNYGQIVHARLKPGEETSGRLVAEVRKRAKKIGEENNIKNMIVDGSPGVACNVISSITGAKKVIIVVESTFSGLHDLKRVYELTQKFRLSIIVVINKYDLSEELTQEIEKYCKENKIEVGLKIPFNKNMVKAIVNKKIPSLEEKEFFEQIRFDRFIDKIRV
ncbi:MinD superfamily P-loop ATPase [Hypnocyclicus thermotrophus]|uniref:MinD superfamily P-loop ATPase n=1 Tax=Hypnocyclicus thermotrophus TaxID=1627895 RepID=A0AA46DZW0_9FUSO|nr:ATP-binding protein [Hypnocyclicus thermotrophus]TDT71949.1 MinD superfamily P-loop ATPase [Hypnocyclicus thermotrophus]